MLNTQNIIDKLKNQGIEADTSQIKLITELVDLNIKKKGFLETYLTKNIKNISPKYLVVGGDWRNKPVVGSEYTEEVKFFDRIPGYSTTAILEKNENLC